MREFILAKKAIFIAASIWCIPAVAYADDQTMREVDEHFIGERQSQESVFKTLPGTHITPINNRMIFTLMVDTLDARIKGKSHPDDPTSETLHVRSYSIAPYIALSGKHFGGGISGEFGEAATHYNESGDDYLEKSRMGFNGVGTHMFYTPTHKSARTRLTFVAGTSLLSVDHRAKSNQDRSLLKGDEWETQRYKVSRSRIGANADFRILENFSLIPWIDYTYTYTHDLTSRINHPNEDKRVRLTERFAGDNDIYWRPGSRWLYGLDVALRVKQFEIHFGNFLGTALNQNRGSDRIINHSYSASIIFLTPTDR